MSRGLKLICPEITWVVLVVRDCMVFFRFSVLHIGQNKPLCLLQMWENPDFRSRENNVGVKRHHDLQQIENSANLGKQILIPLHS